MKTKRGKIHRGTFGKVRQKKSSTSSVVTENKNVEKDTKAKKSSAKVTEEKKATTKPKTKKTSTEQVDLFNNSEEAKQE